MTEQIDWWYEKRAKYPHDRFGPWVVSSGLSTKEDFVMVNIDYPKLLDNFPQHLDPKRTESASFLIWYLENYYRLDSLEAVDAVCDQHGDRGVDGIFVNDENQTITIFQSRISQNSKATIGDKALREFAGTIGQFEEAESILALIQNAEKTQVSALAKRLDLEKKISSHDLRGEFISNVDIDANGEAFLAHEPSLIFVGKKYLVSSYISSARNTPIHAPTTFDVFGLDVMEYVVDKNTRAVIAPVMARELVNLNGIADQSLYTYNVRGPLGKTAVNKDISKSIGKPEFHKEFPLFHNGITIIANNVEHEDDKITVDNYFVVNGCQSLTALYDNQEKLTDNLRVLVKFIQADPTSDRAAKITQFSNNQNGVKARDFKSNDQMQIRLQNDFLKNYAGEYGFEIKRGEEIKAAESISNEEAGLYLMAFDLKEPWATHRRYTVFEDKHAELFGRPEVTSDRIVLCQIIISQIIQALPKIDNQLFARYKLTRYLLLYIVRLILDNDKVGREVIAKPRKFVRKKENRERLIVPLARIVSDVVIDVSEDVRPLGDDFDYRGKLRDKDWVEKFAGPIIATHRKLVSRGSIPSFESDWNNGQAKA